MNRYLVIDIDINRKNWPCLVGKVFDEIPPYVAIQKLPDFATHLANVKSSNRMVVVQEGTSDLLIIGQEEEQGWWLVSGPHPKTNFTDIRPIPASEPWETFSELKKHS